MSHSQEYAEGLIRQGTSAWDLLQSTFQDGTDLGTLLVVTREIRRRLADPQDPVHSFFHRHINPDGEQGGWVQDGLAHRSVSPKAQVGRDAIIFGPSGFALGEGMTFTSVGPEAVIAGHSAIGPGVQIHGKSRVEDSALCGARTGNGIARHFGIFSNRVTITSFIAVDQCILHDSSVKESFVSGSVLRRADVKNKAWVALSQIKNGEVDGAVVYDSTVKGGSRVGQDVHLEGCRVTKGVSVDVPQKVVDQKIDDNRYALVARPPRSLVKDALQLAAGLFERPKKKENPGQEPDRGTLPLRK
ncbi:MAG: hypothetical protein PW734_07380 [Verrucomicrobium sp.]|nr:hypothetical protein [Verrucomicrobium sp.]